MMFSCNDTPLCPAGHEGPSPTPPHKGEGLNLLQTRHKNRARSKPPAFSPLVGEMPAGREGLAPHTDTAISRIQP